MPINTDLTVNQPAQGGFLANPLGLVGEVVGIKGQLLQQQGAAQSIAIQQQTMNAHTKAGQIIANSPPGDFAAMTSALQSDPDVMAWTPDILKSVNEGKQAILGAQGLQLDQNSKAFDLYRSMIPSIIKNPTPQGVKDSISQVLSVVPPQMREQIKPMLEASAVGLMRGATGDPQHDADIITNNAVGQVLGSGLDPSKAFAAAGTTPPRVEMTPTGPGGAPQATTLGGLPKPGAPVPTGITPEAEEFQKKTAETSGEIMQETSENSKALPSAMRRVNLMTQALGQFQAGGGADARGALGQFAQALQNIGVDLPKDLTPDAIANSSLPGTQVFQSLISRAAVQTLKTDAQGTGRVMQMEVNRYLESMSASQDPKTLLTLLNNMKYTMGVSYDQAQKLPEFLSLLEAKDPSVKGMNRAMFHTWYNRQALQPDYAPALPPGLQPTQPGEIKGAAPAPVKNYNPKTGNFE
jgi:hypothetical protein